MDQKEFYKNLSKKRMGAGMLIFNEKNELLIVKPGYKDYWSIPGGIVEKNESPQQAVVREVKEEIGLDIKFPKLLGVDWKAPTSEKNESLQFMFFGGILKTGEIEKIKLAFGEINEHQFLPLEKALPLLNEALKRRIPKCVKAFKNNTAAYLENGEYPADK